MIIHELWNYIFQTNEIQFDETIRDSCYKNICILLLLFPESSFLIKLHISFSLYEKLYDYIYVTPR